MNKMSPAEERAITRDLLSVVDAVRSGADAADALVKVAADRGYQAPVVSRMCEAYNKAKSVHVLRSTGVEKRADSFSLINPNDVLGKLFGTYETDDSVFKPIAKPSEGVDKNASELSKMGVRPDSPRSRTPFNSIYDKLKKAETRENAAIEKKAGEIKRERLLVERAVDKVCGHVKSMPNKELNKIAQKIHNKYGFKGDQLMRVVYHKLGKTLPDMDKTAKTTILPLDEPYVSLVGAMDGFHQYNNKKAELDQLEKTAAAGQVLAAMGLPAMGDVLEARNKRDEVEDKGGDDLFGPELVNKLKALDAVDTFADMYAGDPFLAQRPVSEVLKAYNTVVRMMPYLLESENKKVFIAPMVRKLVGEGGRIDPVEISKYLKDEKTVAESEEARAKTESNERSAGKAEKKEQLKTTPDDVLRQALKGTVDSVKAVSDTALKTTSGFLKATTDKGREIQDIMDKNREKQEADIPKTLERRFAKLPKSEKERMRDLNLLRPKAGATDLKDISNWEVPPVDVKKTGKDQNGNPYTTNTDRRNAINQHLNAGGGKKK